MTLAAADSVSFDQRGSTLRRRTVYLTVVGLCEICEAADATEILTFADGVTYGVCPDCAPSGSPAAIAEVSP